MNSVIMLVNDVTGAVRFKCLRHTERMWEYFAYSELDVVIVIKLFFMDTKHYLQSKCAFN